MSLLSLDNPVFFAYALAAAIMLAKLMLAPWLTVLRMARAKGGFLNPEDLRRSPANRQPSPAQLQPDADVERARRINRNDLESIPGFVAAGLLFVLAEPPLLLAQVLFAVYVVSRLAHFVAYLTACLHDVRAALWAPGSLCVLAMLCYVLLALAG